MIDITLMSQLYPVFLVLTTINVTASYLSVRVIDETYFNNQRAYILFNEYFSSGDKQVLSVEKANSKEKFYLPNILNRMNCKFIRYGHFSIYEVLASSKPHYYTQSVLQQLDKQDRLFVYHVKLIPKLQRRMKGFLNNGRIYQIHVNMNQRA